MNENTPNEIIKYTDLNYLYERTKSKPELLKEMIGLYLEQTPVLITTMKKSLVDKDWQSLQAAVHKMIPSFSIVGITKEFEDIAKKIQNYSQAQMINDELHAMVVKIEYVCEQACNELNIKFTEIKNNKND